MKFRRDFVTNSSSSSFIVGKYEDKNIDRDYVFNLMKGFYKEFLEDIERFKKDMTKYGVYLTVDKCGWNLFKFKDDVSTNQRLKRSDEIRKKYNIDVFSYFRDNYNWLKCKNYSEYEKYWIEEINKLSCCAPFSIQNYAGGKGSFCIEGGKWGTTERHNIEDGEGLLSWYYPCYSSFIQQKKEGITEFWCNQNEECHYCNLGLDSPKCKEFKKKILSKSLTSKNAVSIILGRVCVHSENGYLPMSVVDKLSKISTYFCNHMG